MTTKKDVCYYGLHFGPKRNQSRLQNLRGAFDPRGELYGSRSGNHMLEHNEAAHPLTVRRAAGDVISLRCTFSTFLQLSDPPPTSNQITGPVKDRNAFISTSTIAVRGSIQNLEAGNVQAE
jgi:hypothetical protein